MSQTNLALGDIEEKRVSKPINVKLQPADLARLGVEAGETAAALSEARDAMKKAVSQVKEEEGAKVSKIEAQFEEILEKLRNQTESRVEEVTEKHIFNANAVQTYYNGEMIEERAMTEGERQTAMELKHGPVLPKEDDEPEHAPETDEEVRADIADVIREERSVNKPTMM